MSMSRWYAKEVRDNTSYLPTWLPIVRVAPGDVGRITDFQFTPLGNLGHFGVPFHLEEGGAPSDIEYYSAGSVSIALKLAGEAPVPGSVLTQAEAGLRVTFGRENAVAFRCSGCTSARIPDQLSLGKQVLALHERGEWPEDLVVVTEVISAGAATVLISSAVNASVDLRAGGRIGSGPVNLAAGDAGFQVVRASNMGMQVVAETGLTPLIRTSGVRARLFRPRVFRGGGPRRPGEPSLRFVDVSYDDYEDSPPISD